MLDIQLSRRILLLPLFCVLFLRRGGEAVQNRKDKELRREEIRAQSQIELTSKSGGFTLPLQ